MDALHILPLGIIPLQNAGLKRARLIKNGRLQGVVELYSSREMGSGQIYPEDLGKAFDLSRQKRPTDFEVIKALSMLPSYDVYSLRVNLRKMGIRVDDYSTLQLSRDKVDLLTDYMRKFTQPLIQRIYGHEEEVSSFQDIIRLFREPDQKTAVSNLKSIADDLHLDVTDIPKFLENYGDVYLSLSYYHTCMEENYPKIKDFSDTLTEIRQNDQLGMNMELMRACSYIENKLENIMAAVSFIIDMFIMHTESMWESMNAEAFERIVSTIRSYHNKIGGGLCALSVKMNLWSNAFPTPGVGGLSRRAEFIMMEMIQGMEDIEDIQYADVLQ